MPAITRSVSPRARSCTQSCPAKNFIDTAVYRAGDQVGAWSYALVGFIGWGIKEAGVIAIVLSALWLANSLWLGKRQEILAEQQADAERNNAEAAATA